MEFSWDERKARENERKHGVTFTLAKTLSKAAGLLMQETNSKKTSSEWQCWHRREVFLSFYRNYL